MQYMLYATTRVDLTPSDAVATIKKFQAWQPPDGLKILGMWGSGANGFVLVETDDYRLVAELMAQFSWFNSFVPYPVLPTDDLAPAGLRGYEWAEK